MSRLKLFLLGPPHIKIDDGVVEIKRRKTLALLAYLAVTGGRQRRDTLATLFWPNSSQSNARAALRRDLSILNKALGGNWLIINRETIGLRTGPDFWFDVEQFQQGLTDCADISPTCLNALTQAVHLYRDDFLTGFTLADCSDFDEWQFFQTENLRQALASALERLAEGYSAEAEYDLAITYGRRWLALDPLHEPAHQQLMQLYAWSNQWAAALRQYQECERILKEEFGVPPSKETSGLYKTIKAKQLPPPFRAEGDKDSEKAKESAKTSRSIPPSPAALHNLPAQTTSFIGRQAELAAIRAELARPEVRLLTLTGPGGAGKTRLGLQVAAEVLDDFADGVFFVTLAPISNPMLVDLTIAESLGMRLTGNNPVAEQLKEYLKDKHLLLLLDNFEHILPGAPMVTDLLAAAPKLKVVVTSRALLRLTGEWDYPVPPLRLPDPNDLPPLKQLMEYEAVQIFSQRARAVKADFTLTDANASAVVEICLRLDGLPLAIELAASRIRLLPPQKILAQLSNRLQFLTGGARDWPSRQQTLRNTIDWSYELLGPQEQTLFQRLSVFSGGCSLEAAEAVGNASGGVDVLNGLESLVDKNLLKQTELDGEPRFGMLETIREYATEQLIAHGAKEAESLHRKHAQFFIELAEKAELNMNGPEQTVWIKQVETDHDNLRAALAWSIDNDIEMALSLAGTLGHFWHITGHHNEGLDWLKKVLNKAKDGQKDLDGFRAKALNKAGYLAYHLGDINQAVTLGEKSVKLWRHVGDGRGLANALRDLGAAMAMQDDRSKARTNLEESIALFRQLEDKQGLVRSIFWYSVVTLHQRDFESSRASAEEAKILAQEVGDVINVGGALGVLGTIEYRQGNYAAAWSLIENSLALLRQEGDMLGIAISLDLLGGLAYRQNNYQLARAYFEESLAIWRKSGSQVEVGWVLYNLGHVALSQNHWRDAAVLLRESLALSHKQKRMQTIAACLVGLAAVAQAKDQPERAALLYGATQALLETLGTNLEATDPDRYDRRVIVTSQAEFDRNVDAVRTTLDGKAFESAWAEGRSMLLEQAVAFAMERDTEA